MKGFNVTKKQAEEVSLIFKSFSHPSRLMMLCRLSDGPCTVQELQNACGLEQAPTSQFLARLRKEGRVTGERDGNQVYYSLTDARLVELMKTLGRLYCKKKENS
jgi:ArsR family transcriptional regulator